MVQMWGDLPAGVPLLFAHLQRHCPIPLTAGGTAHRPPRLLLGGCFLLSVKYKTARRRAVAEAVSSFREKHLSGPSGMPGFSGPQGEQWLATCDVILGDKLYLMLQTCLWRPETKGEVLVT